MKDKKLLYKTVPIPVYRQSDVVKAGFLKQWNASFIPKENASATTQTNTFEYSFVTPNVIF